MLYALIIIGIVLIAYGLLLIRDEKQRRGETFKEIIVEKEKDDSQYISLLVSNQELAKKVNSIDTRMAEVLTGFVDIQDMLGRADQESHTKVDQESHTKADDDANTNMEYGQLAQKIKRMLRANMDVDEIATDLNIGKGEVLLIQKLLEK
ncbi:MAG TPA: hypothetical protein VFD33_04710 [Bacillota bacterium]|nr:hypothetical protein [Bacillota bacterium]